MATSVVTLVVVVRGFVLVLFVGELPSTNFIFYAIEQRVETEPEDDDRHRRLCLGSILGRRRRWGVVGGEAQVYGS